MRRALGGFWRTGRGLEQDCLAAEHGVGCGEADGSGLFGGPDPDGTGATDEREGVVADEGRGAFKMEDDGVPGEGANAAELIVDAEHDAGSVGTIGDELSVVWQKNELAIDALA